MSFLSDVRSHKLHLEVSLLALFLIVAGCPTLDEPCMICPPRYVQQIFLDTIYSEASEVAVLLYATDSIPDDTYQLLRDSTLIFSGSVMRQDTILIDGTVMPNQAYLYRAYRLQAGLRQDSSTALLAQTEDSTRQAFTWQTDTLGDGNSSRLFDVAIVDESLAYAVGEIYIRDSTGLFNVTPYNFAEWNGKRWSLKTQATYVALRAVLAFSSTDIWVCSSAPYHWNGISWTGYNVQGSFDGYVNKIWGRSSSDIYIVGTNGAIAHFDGTSWVKQGIDSDIDWMDVFGSGRGEVTWICGYHQNVRGTSLLRRERGLDWDLAYDGSGAQTLIRPDSFSGTFSTVFVPTTNRVFMATDAGLYKAVANTHGEGQRSSFLASHFPGFPRRLRGTGANDFVLVGNQNLVAHFNGVRWRHFSDLQQTNESLNSVDQKKDFIVAVGEIYDPVNSRGLILRGNR
jgi:hypothetical protein